MFKVGRTLWKWTITETRHIPVSAQATYSWLTSSWVSNLNITTLAYCCRIEAWSCFNECNCLRMSRGLEEQFLAITQGSSDELVTLAVSNALRKKSVPPLTSSIFHGCWRHWLAVTGAGSHWPAAGSDWRPTDRREEVTTESFLSTVRLCCCFCQYNSHHNDCWRALRNKAQINEFPYNFT